MGTQNYQLLVRNIRLVSELKQHIKEKLKNNPADWKECAEKAAIIFLWNIDELKESE